MEIEVVASVVLVVGVQLEIILLIQDQTDLPCFYVVHAILSLLVKVSMKCQHAILRGCIALGQPFDNRYIHNLVVDELWLVTHLNHAVG